MYKLSNKREAMHTPNLRIGERHVRPRKALLELLLVVQRRKSDGSRIFAASALVSRDDFAQD